MSGPVSVRCCQHFSCRGFGTICPKVPAFVEGGTMPKYYPINEEAAKRAKAMNLMGMNVGPLRSPMCEMGEDNARKLAEVMKAYGLKLA